MRKKPNHTKVAAPHPSEKGQGSRLASRWLAPALFFVLAWLWASWWMGDLLRITYEQSFFAANATLMHWLWQQPFGSLWILGRALLTLYHWPLVGGLVVALLLTAGSWLVGYCLRLPLRWRWIQYLPASAWMTWVAWLGLNLYFQSEPGRIFGALLLGVLVCAVDAFIIWTFKKPLSHGAAIPLPSRKEQFLKLLFILACFALPLSVTHLRHPYVRPLSRMQVQLLHQDWQGMVGTAHENASLSYRPLAAFYAIALVHTGHLADQLFDIRLEFDSLYLMNRNRTSDVGSELYTIDGDYHAGLFRAATHKAMEHLTMQGPTLFSLKHLSKLALLNGDWSLARKYLKIIGESPFESAFVEKYANMLENPERVEADPEFAVVRKTEPLEDSFEGQYQQPTFLGYTAVLTQGRSQEALIQSLMANLYSKRMPDFLYRCQPFVGRTPPTTIVEGLITQSIKNQAILQAFPISQMELQRYQAFLRVVAPYMKNRAAAPVELFEQYRGYYPYYYFFGNLRVTRKRDDAEASKSNAGVN